MWRMFAVALTLPLIVLSPKLRADRPATQPVEAPRVTLYAAVVTPGPVWKASIAAGKRLDLTRHFAYVARLRGEGKIVLGGPFADESGGLIIYRVDTLAEAKGLIDNDPAVLEKLFAVELHPWLVNSADLPLK